MSEPDVSYPNEALVIQHSMTLEGLERAWRRSNRFLTDVPGRFAMDSKTFFSIVNQRNLSGLIGEAFRHALAASEESLVPNPHPDGRPDLLDLSIPGARSHYEDACFDAATRAPRRSELAPFKYGGIEVKSTIGNVVDASLFEIGDSRINSVTGLTYWAHHRHACSLLGVYYDYDAACSGAPQVKVLFLAEIAAEDWGEVSVGRADRKKTSNTALLGSGRSKILAGLIAYEHSGPVVRMLERVGAAGI